MHNVTISAGYVQWLRSFLSKGPNWVDVFCPLIWGRKQTQFPKSRVFYFLEYRMMEKAQKPSNSMRPSLFNFLENSKT
jgi:hypothetical protein